jgi:ABC-type transport system substrate-binding protein
VSQHGDQEQLERGVYTRKQVIRGAAAMGMGLALGPLIAACGSSDGAAAGSSAAAVPRTKGGTLVVAYQQEPATLDPAIAWNNLEWIIEHCVFEGLYRYSSQVGKETELEPCLADGMPVVSNGGKTYTIKLRKGVKFQAPVSREVTAEDFTYTFERMMRMPLAPATYFYTNIVGVADYMDKKADHVAGFKALDEGTLQIDLVQPQSSFLNILTMEFCDVVAKEWCEKWGDKQIGRHPLGTGPFAFDHWTVGQEVVLKANPSYWDAGRVYLDKLQFVLSYTPETAFLKLQRGDVDILGDNLPAADIPRMTHDPSWKPYVLSAPLIATQNLFLNVGIKPFDDLRVREALSWAVNRDKLVKLLSGSARALWQVYPEGMPGYVAGKKYYGYDPQKAKELLSAAGYPDGFSTTIWTDNVDPRPKLMQSIQNDLAEIGVMADIKSMSNQTYSAFASTPKTCAMGPSGWWMDYPDPSDWMALYSKGAAVKGGTNCTFWWSPQLEKMMVEAEKIQDSEARIAEYDKIQDYIMSQAPYVSMYQPVMTTMHSKRLGGMTSLHPVYWWEPQWMWVG